MEARFSSPIACPVVFGRTRELSTLRLLIERVRSGETQVVLISGEAGIGKSRLAAEVKAELLTHGFLLLEGQCFQADSTSPMYRCWTSFVHISVVGFRPPLPTPPILSPQRSPACCLSWPCYSLTWQPCMGLPLSSQKRRSGTSSLP